MQKNILLVEDSRLSSKIISDFLIENGYKVENVDTGEAAVKKACSSSFADLIIMDIELAGCMLFALRSGLFFPRVYLFLISSGGFALLVSYAVIMATHIRFRRKHGCPPDGNCQMRGFPYTSVFVLVSLIAAIASMPFVKDQLSGLIAGVCLVAFYTACYGITRYVKVRKYPQDYGSSRLAHAEFSEELNDFNKDED